MAIKISEHEAQKLGTETIAFKDGSGYMAEMAVFHELHCIVSWTSQRCEGRLGGGY